MTERRFYIGKKDADDYAEDLEFWIDQKIPPPPPGTKCECDKDKHAHESPPDDNMMVTIVDCPNEADSYLYRIKDDHVCYTYMCTACAEAQCSDSYLGDYLADHSFPTTAGGYAVTPRHCL